MLSCPSRRNPPPDGFRQSGARECCSTNGPLTKPDHKEIEMADQTVDDRFNYVPGKTLGRSGYIEGNHDKLATRVRQLDALLCLVSCSDGSSEDGQAGFFSLNKDIQRATLELASSLATEIHELHEEISIQDMKQQMQNRASSQPQH